MHVHASPAILKHFTVMIFSVTLYRQWQQGVKYPACLSLKESFQCMLFILQDLLGCAMWYDVVLSFYESD